MKRIAAFLSLLAFSLAAPAREIVDMAGRHVQIPDKIERLYSPSPFGSYLMYSLAPDLMTGRAFAQREAEDRLFTPEMRRKPVLGVTLNNSANVEAIVKSNPQALVLWDLSPLPANDKANAALASLGIPYVYLYGNRLTEYPAAMRFLGRLTGRTARAEMLAGRAESILASVNAVVRKVPPAQRPRVYYAEGLDGLMTDCTDSFHAEVFLNLGDVNVHRCHFNGGMEKISLEQVLLYQPDVIVAQSPVFYAQIYGNPAWRQLKAVREGRVYLVPNKLMNWVDYPPSFMRFLGLQWLANILYPELYPLDIVKTAQEFYRTYMGVSLSAQEVKALLR